MSSGHFELNLTSADLLDTRPEYYRNPSENLTGNLISSPTSNTE